jgi:hypothetical protein
MVKIIIYLIVGLLAFEAISCATKVVCPEFDQIVYDWLPYAQNDTIILVKETKDDSILLFTESTIIQHTTHYLSNLDCGNCWDQILIGNYNNKANNLYISVRLEKNKIETEEYFIKGSYFDYSRSDYTLKKNYPFNGAVYSEVKIFENEKSLELFTQLIVSKNYGIIGLADKNGFKWFRRMDYLLKIVKMQFNNKACD